MYVCRPTYIFIFIFKILMSLPSEVRHHSLLSPHHRDEADTNVVTGVEVNGVEDNGVEVNGVEVSDVMVNGVVCGRAQPFRRSSCKYSVRILV